MSKMIATDKMNKKMIIPVSKKLTAEVGLCEKKMYICYFKDGLLIVGEPMNGFVATTFDQGRSDGYASGYDEGYNEGHADGAEEGYVEGYHKGYDDAIEGNGYRNMRFYDCGIDCDYDCEHCRLQGKN